MQFSKERNLDLKKECEDLNFDVDQSNEVENDYSQHIIEGDSEKEETLNSLTRKHKYTRRVFASVRSCKILVGLSLLFRGNNKVPSYFVGFALKSAVR